jgi:hypothetical protein
MAVDFKTFLTTVPFILDTRLPVLLRGRHGIGKSVVVYMIAKQRDLPVIERRASQMERTGLADRCMHSAGCSVLGRGGPGNAGSPPRFV